MSKKDSEKNLLGQLAKGDRLAFKVLHDKYAPMLFDYGNQICSDQELIKDILQELFVDLWNRRKDCIHIRDLKFYLFRAIRNQYLKSITSKINFVPFNKSDITISSFEEELVAKENFVENLFLVRRELQNLNENQREIIFLRFTQGFTITELSEILKINKQSVSNLIHRSILTLKKRIQKKLSA